MQPVDSPPSTALAMLGRAQLERSGKRTSNVTAWPYDPRALQAGTVAGCAILNKAVAVLAERLLLNRRSASSTEVWCGDLVISLLDVEASHNAITGSSAALDSFRKGAPSFPLLDFEG